MFGNVWKWSLTIRIQTFQTFHTLQKFRVFHKARRSPPWELGNLCFRNRLELSGNVGNVMKYRKVWKPARDVPDQVFQITRDVGVV